MQQNLTDHTKKRLQLVAKASAAGDSILAHTELDWLHKATLVANKGPRANASGSLDILCISALVDKVSACLSPAWIPLRCHHGNETWKMIRCRKCEGCHHAWRSKVRALILNGCYAKRCYMWTLTIPEYPDTMGLDRFDFTQRRWHDLLRDTQRRGVKFEYLRVVEMQKRGTLHFHIALKDFTVGAKDVSNTKDIAKILRAFGKKAGFGYKQGKTTDFQSARLSGAGVASYMSKYLEKSEDFYALRREDGRAIRRYCRSRGWSNTRTPAVWRYASNGPITRKAQSVEDVKCSCGDHETLDRNLQVKKWLAANRTGIDQFLGGSTFCNVSFLS